MPKFPNPSTRPHGTYAWYKRGCRCEPCATHQRERVKANRAARRANKGRLTHGTRSAYDAGCRCDQCKGRRALAHRLEYVPLGVRR